jgi:hypothetical protein
VLDQGAAIAERLGRRHDVMCVGTCLGRFVGASVPARARRSHRDVNVGPLVLAAVAMERARAQARPRLVIV